MARIVIMEDDKVLGLELAAELRALTHDVVLTGSAEAAKHALWHWDVDVLITDLIVRKDGRPIPGGGLSLISWVRQTQMMNRRLKHLPIIAVSGEDQRLGKAVLLPTADRIGADKVLEKPVDIPSLSDAIDQLHVQTTA